MLNIGYALLKLGLDQSWMITFINFIDIQGAIQKFEYVSNCALSIGAICLKILPFDCLSVMLCFSVMTCGCREAEISR